MASGGKDSWGGTGRPARLEHSKRQAGSCNSALNITFLNASPPQPNNSLLFPLLFPNGAAARLLFTFSPSFSCSIFFSSCFLFLVAVWTKAETPLTRSSSSSACSPQNVGQEQLHGCDHAVGSWSKSYTSRCWLGAALPSPSSLGALHGNSNSSKGWKGPHCVPGIFGRVLGTDAHGEKFQVSSIQPPGAL